MLNYSMFKCTLVNSPLTTSVTGQSKNIIVAFVGLFALGDVIFDPINVLGHCICSVGAVMYFMATLKNKKSASTQKETEMMVRGKPLPA